MKSENENKASDYGKMKSENEKDHNYRSIMVS